MLLYAKDGDICVLLNKRTDHVEHHKGEISFPGGVKDPEDATIMDTALRKKPLKNWGILQLYL